MLVSMNAVGWLKASAAIAEPQTERGIGFLLLDEIAARLVEQRVDDPRLGQAGDIGRFERVCEGLHVCEGYPAHGADQGTVLD